MFCFIALITSSSPCLKDQFAINNNFSSSYYCTQDSGLQLGDPAPLNSLSLWTCCFCIYFAVLQTITYYIPFLKPKTPSR